MRNREVIRTTENPPRSQEESQEKQDIHRAVRDWFRNVGGGEISALTLYERAKELLCQATNQPAEILEAASQEKTVREAFADGQSGIIYDDDDYFKPSAEAKTIAEILEKEGCGRIAHLFLIHQAFDRHEIRYSSRQQDSLLLDAGLDEGSSIWALLYALGVAQTAREQIIAIMSKPLEKYKHPRGLAVTLDNPTEYFAHILAQTENYYGFLVLTEEAIGHLAKRIFKTNASVALSLWQHYSFLKTTRLEKRNIAKEIKLGLLKPLIAQNWLGALEAMKAAARDHPELFANWELVEFGFTNPRGVRQAALAIRLEKAREKESTQERQKKERKDKREQRKKLGYAVARFLIEGDCVGSRIHPKAKEKQEVGVEYIGTVLKGLSFGTKESRREYVFVRYTSQKPLNENAKPWERIQIKLPHMRPDTFLAKLEAGEIIFRVPKKHLALAPEEVKSFLKSLL